MSVLLVLTGCINIPTKSGLPDISQADPYLRMNSTKLMPYRLQMGDVIDVKFISNHELNEQLTVRHDGMISTEYVEDVPAYGRTIAELRADLERRYKNVLTNPKIGIIVRSSAPNRVYVAGEVNNPGEFISVGPNLTLLQVIARAGGLKNSAQPDNIVIIRRGDGEESKVYSANYAAAAAGTDIKSDARLVSYDIVFVPRSGIGNTYLYYQQYVQQFLPVGLGYQLNSQTSVSGR